MDAEKNPPADSESIPGRDIVSTRVIAATPAQLFETFRDPDRLEQWWGPKDFTCTIHQFDLRPGGTWRLTLHGPDGTNYENEKVFVVVEPAKRIVLRHLDPVHAFEMTIAFTPQGAGTLVYWRLRFDSEAECARIRSIVVEANEQNLDRLEAHLNTLP